MHQAKTTHAKTPSASPAGFPTDQAAMTASVHQLRAAGVSKAIARAIPLDPTTTLIRMPELLAMTALGGRATIYRLLKDDPTFPRPVPLSTSKARSAPVAWVLAEVQAWVRARIAARTTKPLHTQREQQSSDLEGTA